MDRGGAARWATVLLSVLTLVGALLRAWQIGDKSLWIDEAFSVWVARQPLAQGVSWLPRIDQHPPLYYALLHLWLGLGDGPAAVRLLSALTSTLNIPVLYALGACLLGRKAGLLAATVLALSPFHVYLAQEARMYALLSLAVTLSLWALAWLVSDGRPAARLISGSAVEMASADREAHPPRLAVTGSGARRTLAGIYDDAPLRGVPEGRRGTPSEGSTAITVLGDTGARRLRLGKAEGGVAWAGYVVATAAALWTHNTAVLYWLAANAIVLGLWVIRRSGTPRVDVLGRRGVAQGDHICFPRCGWYIPMCHRAASGCRPTLAQACSSLATSVWVEPTSKCGPPRVGRGGSGQAGIVGCRRAGRNGSARADALAAPPLRAWALAQGAVLLLWVPWLPSFAHQSAAVYRHFWLPAPTWRTVLRAAGDFLCAFLPRRIGWALAIWAGYGALLALGLWALRRRRGRSWLLLAAFLVPVGGTWLVSAVRPVFYDRTLIWATIPLYLVLAAGVAGLRYRSFILATTAMLATLSLLSLRDYYVSYQKEAWDEAAAYVAARAEEGDLVLFHATWTQLPFDFYFQGYGMPVEERGVPVDLFARGVLEPRMTADDVPFLQDLVGGRERAWLVYSHQGYTDPEGLVPQALGEVLALRGRRRFYGLEVRLYAQRDR
jgi:hypothetical protein